MSNQNTYRAMDNAVCDAVAFATASQTVEGLYWNITDVVNTAGDNALYWAVYQTVSDEDHPLPTCWNTWV